MHRLKAGEDNVTLFKAGNKMFLVDKNLEHVKFRVPDYEDIPFIRDIEIKSFEEPYSEDIIAGLISMSRVAIVDSKIVGYVLCLEQDDSLFIVRLAVHQNFRDRGIARLLLHVTRLAFEERFQYLNAWVLDSQEDALRLFASSEFKITEGSQDSCCMSHG